MPPDQRRGEMHLCVRHEQIDQGEREPQHDQRQQVKNKAADQRHVVDKISGGFQMRSARQSQRSNQEQRAEGDRRPVKDGAPKPVASARHAPDVVEGRFDAGQHPDGNEHQQYHARDAERAAARGLHEIMNIFRRLLLSRRDAGIVAGRCRCPALRDFVRRDDGEVGRHSGGFRICLRQGDRHGRGSGSAKRRGRWCQVLRAA